MKKTRIILVAIVLTFAFKVFSQESLELPEYIKYQKLSKEQLISVNLSGRIAGVKNTIQLISAEGTIIGEPSFKKTIKVAADGSFKVKLTLPKNSGEGYTLMPNKPKEFMWLLPFHLEDGYNLTINTSTKDIINRRTNGKIFVKFTGNGAIKNQLIQDRGNIRSWVIVTNGGTLDKKSFDNKFQAWKNSLDSLYRAYKNKGIDRFIAQQKMKDKDYFKAIQISYARQRLSYLLRKKLEGKPSPKFTNYENFKGGTTSLDDFKGRYVYIDVWATWCAPCKAEIPYLKKIEEKYHGKNITFVSISTDNKGSYNRWKKMIVDKKMSGVQLIADNDFKSKFVRDYKINSIPRFILIDPKGNVVKSVAPRPSDPKLKALFKKLGI